MKYPKITELIPQGEHFDESAVNEGVWMSEPHLNSIESALATSGNSLATTQSQLEARATELSTANAALATLKADATASASTNKTQAARITELEAEVAELGKKSSGKGTILKTSKDENPEEEEVPVYADDNAPINSWFDKQTRYMEKPKA